MRIRLYLARHSLPPSRTRDVRDRVAVFSSILMWREVCTRPHGVDGPSVGDLLILLPIL
jgi:hypothetical protein